MSVSCLGAGDQTCKGVAVNATVLATPNVKTAADCAQACIDHGADCISINHASDSCQLNGYSRQYVVAADPLAVAYYVRKIPRNDDPMVPAVAYKLETPTSGVSLLPGSLLRAGSSIAWLTTWRRLGYFAQA